MIPPIIHQTAARRSLPQPLEQLQQQSVSLLPDWKFRFYDDDQCRQLITLSASWCLPFYDSLPTGVQRSDLFRWVAVYTYGGFYMDCDIELHADLSDLRQHSLVLAEEKTITREEADKLGHQHTTRIANYMFGAQPGHPWIKQLLQFMLLEDTAVNSDFDVLESTGPGFVTRHFHNSAPAYIKLLQHPGHSCERCGGQSCQFGVYASHLHVGSWRQ